MIRSFGVLLAIGIVVVLVADVVLSTAILGAREYRSPTPQRDYTTDAVGRGIVKLGSMSRSAVPVLMVGSLAVFVGGAIVDPMLDLQTDPEEWVDQDSEVVQDLDTLRAETGSASELGYFIQSDDVFSDENVEFVHTMATRELGENEELLTASSIVTTVSFLMDVPNTTELAPTAADVEAAYGVAPEDIRLSTVAPEGGALNLIFRVGEGSLADRADLIDEIETRIEPPAGSEATASGLAVVGAGLLRNIEANRTVLTYAALLFVGLFLTLRLKSPVRALLCLVPVLVAVGATSIVVASLGFKLSPLTAVGGPLVVALCTEFTTLIILRYMEERRRGCDPQAASDVAAARTGRAFVASALTTVGGFAVLVFSELPLLRDFGAIVALNVGVALLSALVVLPPILVWADNRNLVMGRRNRTGGSPPAGTARCTSERAAASGRVRAPAHRPAGRVPPRPPAEWAARAVSAAGCGNPELGRMGRRAGMRTGRAARRAWRPARLLIDGCLAHIDVTQDRTA